MWGGNTMKHLNKLSLSICLLFGLLIVAMGIHIDSIVKENYFLRNENRLLISYDSLGRIENIDLRLANKRLDVENYLIKNEIYKLKNK